MPYQIGDVARVSIEFRDIAGTLVDPTTVTFNHTPPSGTAGTPLVFGVDAAVVKDSVGIYHVDLALSSSGTWRGSWVSTGTAISGENWELFVESTALATWNLVSLEEAKRHLKYDTDTSDEDLAKKIAQASAIVMNYLKLTSIPATWTFSDTLVVQAVVLEVAGELDKHRAASEMNPLSNGVVLVLARLRDPALA